MLTPAGRDELYSSFTEETTEAKFESYQFGGQVAHCPITFPSISVPLSATYVITQRTEMLLGILSCWSSCPPPPNPMTVCIAVGYYLQKSTVSRSTLG